MTTCPESGHCYNPDDLDPRECGRCHEMERELTEQAICNGKGSEREVKLSDDYMRLKSVAIDALIELEQCQPLFTGDESMENVIKNLRIILELDEVQK